MKATRKLIPAFAMLLIAAVMMSTATFAWFSTNSQVTAQGFNVTVKADNAYIVISETADDVNGKATNVNILDGVAGVLIPSRPTPVSGEVNANWYGQSAITWQTGTSESASNGMTNVDYETISVSENSDSDYAIHKTLYIRSAKGFPAAQNLILSKIDVGSDLAFASAVSVVIKCNGKYFNYVNGTSPKSIDAVLDDSVTDAEDTVIEVLIYVNGDNENVKTDNATTTNLQGMTVTLTFTTGEVSTGSGT